MKFVRKLMAVLLAMIIAIGSFPGNQKTVYAEPTFFLTAYAFESGILTLRWPALAGAKSVKVTYHIPGNPPELKEITNVQSTNTIDIPGLLNDIVYDIVLEVYGDESGTNPPIGRGLLYFCPNISFTAKSLEQDREPVPGGGYEIGVKPALNLKWTIPKAWYEATNTFEYINKKNVMLQIQQKVNLFYDESREFDTFNFRINISTDYGNLNSGSTQAAVLVNQESPTDPISYKATVSGSSLTADVRNMDASGSINFDLIGRGSKSSELPEPQNFQLPHEDILPGTVYYMNIKPIVKNSAGDTVNCITVGPAMEQNGSRLTGVVPYVYTPIRFQLSRDEANNVYAKVFRINQGSLDLPALKYEIQTSDDPTIEGDWTVRKSLNDSYFPDGADYTLTAFTVNNINNLIYYKVVVKTDSSSDRLESPKMGYIIKEDNSRPPVPTNLTIVDRTAVPGDVYHPQTNAVINIKTTDITISWNKPSNWSEIKNATPYDESNDLYFHFLLSTSQSDISTLPYPRLEFNGMVYGEFQAKYRLVRYVSANSPNIIEDGNRLVYKLKGFELFKGEDADGMADNDIDNPDGYPAYLIPNKVYYLQMYTASGAYKGTMNKEQMSDRSVPVSFTTLTMNGKEVPMPYDLRLTKNNIETVPESSEITNSIELQFDKVNINWADYTSNLSVSRAVYYDLYASNSTAKDSFINVGSTEYPLGDVKFIGTDQYSTSIKVMIDKFSENDPNNLDPSPYSIFGPKLKPNTTYYFTVRTRIVFGDSRQESMFTAILPVTTVNGRISPPDESFRKPIAPDDFSIAQNSSGNLLVSGSSVTFQWTNSEPDVIYEIICTTNMLAPDAPPSMYTDDMYYNSFISALGNISLDPGEVPLPDNFTYDISEKKCQYSIDRWLLPNKLYYFSIRAINKSDGKTSAWICIPVTTLLIESPDNLIPVTGSEIGISWEDTSVNVIPDDFKIYVKGPDDKDFKALARSNYVVSRENTIYYGRIFNLKYNSLYDVRVYKGNTQLSLIFEKKGIVTMDKEHQVEVKWKGRIGYKYELAIKSADDVDYTILSDLDLEQYANINSGVLPYYIEKSPERAGTEYYNFYARIKTVATLQADGTVKRVPLKSNMKYYIKVRAYKVDTFDLSAVSFSKYVGPASIRTEFNQDDYDKVDEDIKKKATFLDKVSKIEESMFWNMAVNSDINKLFIKEERMKNGFQNNGRYPYVLDITPSSSNIDTDIVYIPAGVIELMNAEDRSLVIKTLGTEFTIRPKSIDLKTIGKINNFNFESKFFKMTVTRSTSGVALPGNSSLASKIISISFKAVDAEKDAPDVEKLINDKLYNKDTGLVQNRLNIILGSDSIKMTPGEMEKYLTDVTNELVMTLADYIVKVVEGQGSTPGIIKREAQITQFNDAVPIKLSYNSSRGRTYPYVLRDGETSWRKLSDQAYTAEADKITLTSANTGKFAVVTDSIAVNDMPESSVAAEDIRKLAAKYDLSKVFGTNGSIYPESTLAIKDAVNLYELITGGSKGPAGLDVKQKIAALGLTDVLGNVSTMKSLERQELAGVIAKLYIMKMGIDIGRFEASTNTRITDEESISPALKKYVMLCTDIKVLLLDEKGNFKPDSLVTRAQAISAIVRVLELTGDIKK